MDVVFAQKIQSSIFCYLLTKTEMIMENPPEANIERHGIRNIIRGSILYFAGFSFDTV